jgi:hypothetical protein
MSSSASISAAKKRRANQVQPPTMPQPMMQRPGSAPAPSLANMTPAQRQQFMIQQQQQQQQRMLQQQQQMQQQSAQKPLSNQSTSSKTGNQKSSSKVPDLTWPMPPIYLMKQMYTILFQQSKTIDELKNRLNCIETGTTPTRVADFDSGSSGSQLILEQTKHSLLVDDEFVSGIVDNIMTNSNLSEIIEQIDTVQTENKELRELLHAQQKTINEMNIMLLKLISQSLSQPVSVPAASVPLPAPVPSSEQPNEECQDEEEDAVADADEDADEDAVADADANDDANAENNIQLDVIETKSKSKSKK